MLSSRYTIDIIVIITQLLLFITINNSEKLRNATRTDLEHCKVSQLGTEYRGKIHMTAGGIRCQSWHGEGQLHNVDPGISDDDFPDKSMRLAKNYCRNPTGDPKGPWCYTMEPSLIDDECGIPLCNFGECRITGGGAEYGGSHEISTSGKKCKFWNKRYKTIKGKTEKFSNRDFPDSSKSKAKNYCRNPDDDNGGAWCYVEEENYELVEREYCDIPFCDDRDCLVYARNASSYSTITSMNSTAGNITVWVKLWDPRDELRGEARLLFSLLPIPTSSEIIADEWRAGTELLISNSGSGQIHPDFDEDNLEPTPNILLSSSWTGLSISWAGGFISVSIGCPIKQIFLDEYRKKNTISSLYDESFLYYGLMGTGVLWSTDNCLQSCEIHTTYGMDFIRIWPVQKSNTTYDIGFQVRADGKISLKLYQSPGKIFPCFTITIENSQLLTLNYQESSKSVKQQLKEVSSANLLDFWMWKHFTLSMFGPHLRLFSEKHYGNEEILYAKEHLFSTIRWFSVGSDDVIAHWALFCTPGKENAVEMPSPPNCLSNSRDYLYKGSQWITKDGQPCVPWSSKDIPEEERNDNLFPDGSFLKALNKCRNPGHDPRGPYCYTKSSSELEKNYCSIRGCRSSECRTAGTANDYIGTLSVTRSGRTCALWIVDEDERKLNKSEGRQIKIEKTSSTVSKPTRRKSIRKKLKKPKAGGVLSLGKSHAVTRISNNQFTTVDFKFEKLREKRENSEDTEKKMLEKMNKYAGNFGENETTLSTETTTQKQSNKDISDKMTKHAGDVLKKETTSAAETTTTTNPVDSKENPDDNDDDDVLDTVEKDNKEFPEETTLPTESTTQKKSNKDISDKMTKHAGDFLKKETTSATETTTTTNPVDSKENPDDDDDVLDTIEKDNKEFPEETTLPTESTTQKKSNKDISDKMTKHAGDFLKKETTSATETTTTTNPVDSKENPDDDDDDVLDTAEKDNKEFSKETTSSTEKITETPVTDSKENPKISETTSADDFSEQTTEKMSSTEKSQGNNGQLRRPNDGIHREHFNESFFPEQSARNASNYCRDPSRNIAGAWCYTTDPDVPQDLCDVPDCDETDECISLVKGQESKRKFFLFPEHRSEGLHFSLKAWEPDNPDSITFTFSADDGLKSRYILKVGAMDNEKVMLYREGEDGKGVELVKKKTLPHLLFLGKWSAFIIKLPRGKIQIFYEESPNALFEWEDTDTKKAFLPVYYSYASELGNTIGVSFDCLSRCLVEKTETERFTRIIPIKANTQRIELMIRAKGVVLVPLLLFPATPGYYALTLGEMNQWIYFMKNTYPNVQIYHKQKIPSSHFFTNDTWTNITIIWFNSTINVYWNETLTFNYLHIRPFLFYFFSLAVDKGGWATWTANCMPPDIDGDPVDGGWSEWSPWACSASCNGGVGTRKRQCNNPVPNVKGEPCMGPSVMAGRCNTILCGDITEDTVNLIKRRARKTHTSIIIKEGEMIIIPADTDVMEIITRESIDSDINWSHNGIFLNPDEKRVQLVDHDIVIKRSEVNDSGVYTITLHRVDGTHMILKLVSLAVLPVKTIITLRETLSMTVVCHCVILGYLYNDLKVYWSINNKIWKDYGTTQPLSVNVDQVVSLNKTHRGMWKCIIRQDDLGFNWTTNAIFVNVIGPPNWKTHLMEDKFTRPIFGWMPNEEFVATSGLIIFLVITFCIIVGTIVYLRFQQNLQGAMSPGPIKSQKRLEKPKNNQIKSPNIPTRKKVFDQFQKLSSKKKKDNTEESEMLLSSSPG